jgi:hypothetical protein
MRAWLSRLLVAAGLMVASWAVLVLLARRPPPGPCGSWPAALRREAGCSTGSRWSEWTWGKAALRVRHGGAGPPVLLLHRHPLGEALARCDAKFAASWWHWFFLGQTAKPAERVINADPDAWYGATAAQMGPEARAYGDPLAVWRGWAEDLRGRSLDCGHHLAEEAPEELAAELRAFLAG